jgi:hypothetical protein
MLIWSTIESFASPTGNPVRVLDAETAFILHQFHALKDRFSYLIGLVDALGIVEREDPDWAFIGRFPRTGRPRGARLAFPAHHLRPSRLGCTPAPRTFGAASQSVA